MNTKVDQAIIKRFVDARRDPNLVVLEGFHALKHANRFGATICEVVAADPAAVQKLAGELAPDLLLYLRKHLETVLPSTFKQLTPAPPPTGVVAIAERVHANMEELMQGRHPIVLLDNPRHYGNIGAVVRVAAAAGVAGVVVLGDHDPWHPEAVRGAAGLQFALPMLQMDALPQFEAPLVAVDERGEPFDTVSLPDGAILAFGSERTGLSPSIRKRAQMTVRIPMAAAVSSLNLATAVAIMLYGLPRAKGVQ